MNRFRILRIQKPHEGIKYKVQERIFNSFGWWCDAGYCTPNCWHKAIFKSIEEAEEFIKEHKKRKIIQVIKEL